MPDRTALAAVGAVGARTALALALAVAVGAPVAATAQEAAPVAAGSVVRFETASDAVLRTDAGAWVGALEIHADGLVINDVTLEDYVGGVAEMPSRWPMEALKAQAVAARTYGWYQARLGTFDRYDTCATVACQVFDPNLAADRDSRWREAVRATEGEVLTVDGRPILARYFSTSGGRTFDNDEVFPTEPPREYLQGVEDPDDAVSPFHRWQVRFTRSQFDDLVARGDTLAAAVPVADVRRDGDTVVVTSTTGASAAVSARALREFLSDVAPAVYPEDFPGPRGDGLPLPTTVPSARFDVEVTPEEVVLHGRGWGHGVGMGQYGARGKAQRGLDHREILAAYYGGLEPTVADAAPDRLRVGLPNAAAPAVVRADRPMRISVDGTVVAERGLGDWRIGASGGTLGVTPPAGYGAPLEVGPTRADPPRVRATESVEVTAEVNKPVELVLAVTAPSGERTEEPLGVVGPGPQTTRWSPDTAGRYDVALVGRDETGAHAGSAATVTAAPAPSDEATGADDGAGALDDVAAVPLWVAAGVGVAALVVVVRRRAGGRR